jgi:hypothetical protein
VDPSFASPEVLRRLPGLDNGAVATLLQARFGKRKEIDSDPILFDFSFAAASYLQSLTAFRNLSSMY